MIPYSKQLIDEDDINEILETLKSDYLTQGPKVPEFEKAVSSYVGSSFGVASNSATSSLHIACLALGLGKNDYLWTSPISFVASANCGLYCGAQVDFVDINPFTFNLDVELLEEKLLEAKKIDKLPKVIVPVHLAGQSCDMEKIKELAKEFGFKIIEDASHAIGGSYKGQKIGNCKYSDICIFSFHPVKIITTCEGGLATTNNEDLAIKMMALRSHGIIRNNFLSKESHGAWYYEQVDLGFNYRMNDLEAVLGLSQLRKLDLFIDARNKIASTYQKILADNSELIFQKVSDDCISAFHLFIVRLKGEKKISHAEYFNALRSNGYFVNLHYIPIYLQPYYKKMGFDRKLFPESEKYYSEAISLPVYPGLQEDEIKKVIHILSQSVGYQSIF
jgi:UDP-4-amino-4,6-dideoxy-N-acetyl-beta-L-altrosamine transaminase